MYGMQFWRICYLRELPMIILNRYLQGLHFISATPNYNNTGRTLVKFNVDPSLLQHSSTAPFFSAYYH